jgi:hypothetical protein
MMPVARSSRGVFRGHFEIDISVEDQRSPAIFEGNAAGSQKTAPGRRSYSDETATIGSGKNLVVPRRSQIEFKLFDLCEAFPLVRCYSAPSQYSALENNGGSWIAMARGSDLDHSSA